MKTILKNLTSITLIILLSNCIGINSDKYREIKPEQIKVSSIKKSKIFINWDFKTNLANNPQQNFIDKAKNDQKNLFVTTLKESDCCEVVYEKEEADIVVNGVFYNESSKAGIYASYVSGFTFTIIPCWINSKARITANVNKGNNNKDYEVKDSTFIAFWAPFIFAMPFNNAFKAESNANINLYKNLVLKMKNDGFFNK